MPDTMRVAIGLPRDATDDHLQLARQLGCEGVVLATPAALPGERRWEYSDLARLRDRVEGFDLRIEAIQNTPHSFWQNVRLGMSGRDEEIENYQETIRNLGRAGIPVLGYNFRPAPLYRTGTKPGRGGAVVTTFDLALAKDRPLTYGREYTADDMWANYEYFIKGVIPVAEEAGVRLAIHPDDPPGPSIGGVARI
ncbi:MAG TPA: mannonate dehydratase, partial [Chloroflexota bacterium]|nr:mannonate dehydratase [Chloroflexota bacterium]